jgi:hypothetical protein
MYTYGEMGPMQGVDSKRMEVCSVWGSSMLTWDWTEWGLASVLTIITKVSLLLHFIHNLHLIQSNLQCVFHCNKCKETCL